MALMAPTLSADLSQLVKSSYSKLMWKEQGFWENQEGRMKGNSLVEIRRECLKLNELSQTA